MKFSRRKNRERDQDNRKKLDEIWGRWINETIPWDTKCAPITGQAEWRDSQRNNEDIGLPSFCLKGKNTKEIYRRVGKQV